MLELKRFNRTVEGFFPKLSLKEMSQIALITLIILLIITRVFVPVIVMGNSMRKTLENGEILILYKMAYVKKAPKYKDIVIIKVNDDFSEDTIVKRVIGTPGDHLVIKDSKVYINGELLIENYINNEEIVTGKYDIDITLEKNEIFVMGYNRNHSSDSRNPNLGVINYKEDVIGKIIYSLSDFEMM